MIYSACESNNSSNLIEKIFEFKIPKSNLPFKSKILPHGNHSMTFTYKGLHKITVGETLFTAKDLIVTGQTKKSYLLNIDEETECVGIIFHPSALYKLSKLDVSTINNKHLPLSEFSKPLYNILMPFFNKMLSGEDALKALEELLKKQPLHINNHTENIDLAIDIINKRGGQISISDLLEQIPVSQKTLETKFKQIVGLTPKRYARLFRFTLLMKKYNENELKFKDLVEIYNFHDGSHFSKEFKYFMNQSPRAYFENESEIIKNT